MRLPRLFRSRKSRKYPIKRDQEGKSLRARCFERFERHQRPADIARELNMQEPTVQRYFRQWQKLGPNFDRKHDYFKKLF